MPASFLRRAGQLFLNHSDAWGVTLMIGLAALIIHQAFSLQNVLLCAAVAYCYWFAFAVNDYYDAPYDAQDARKVGRNAFIVGRPSQAAALLLAFVLLLPPALVFISYGLRAIPICALSLFILWGYSAPPLRLKTRPILDLVTHALFVQTFPYFLCVYLPRLDWLRQDWMLISLFLLSSLAAQLEQQIRDYEVDAQTEQTFTTVFGRPTSALLLRLVTILLILDALLHLLVGMIPAVLWPFALIALPIVLHRLVRGKDQPRSETLVRLSLAAALAYAGLVWGLGIGAGA